MYQIGNVSSLIHTDNIAIEMKQYVAFVLLHYMSLSAVLSSCINLVLELQNFYNRNRR